MSEQVEKTPALPGALGSDEAVAVRTLRRDGRGATMVEFALLAVPLLFMLVAIFETAIAIFLGQQLDHAAMVAAREIRVAGRPIASAAQLRDDVVCPALLGLFDCDGIIVAVDDDPTSRPDPAMADRWCPGGAGSIVSLSLTARIQSLDPWVAPAGTTSNERGLILSSSTMFRRELVANAGDVTGSGC